MINKNTVPLKDRIRFRLMLFGIIMSILPLVTLGYFYVQNFKSNLEENIALNIKSSTERVAADLEFLIGGQISQVTSVTNVVGEKLFNREENIQEGILYNLLQEAPFIEEISLVDAAGREITGVSRRLVLNKEAKDFKSKEAFQQLRDGNIKWSRSFIDPYGQVRLQRVIPIDRTRDGQFLGGLLLEISLRGVIDQLSKKNPEYQEATEKATTFSMLIN